ncbi:MAG: T9SS type A sorting domain-containing protein [Bacteroidales bacterium]|nr:T9SS type A sorting domain-containing protein [Bacteroidales bacterium]
MKKIYSLILAILLVLPQLSAQSYGTIDLGIWFIDNGTSQNQIYSMTVPYGSDFNTCFAVYNFHMGYDYVNFYDTLHFDAYMDGQLIGMFGSDVQNIPLESGVFFNLLAMPASYIASHNYYGTHTFGYKVSPSAYWTEAAWEDNIASITVTFEAPPAVLRTIQVINTDGTVSPSGMVTVNNGDNQAFTITAPTGRHIANVYADGVDVTASANLVTTDNVHGTYTFYNVTSDHTFFVTYAVDEDPDGVAEFAESSISVTPNPATDQIVLSSSQPIALAEVFDLSGRRVMSVAPADCTLQLSVSDLESGVYFVKLLTGGETVVKKFVKK